MIEGCKHGPTFLIPQPCAECARDRERSAALDEQVAASLAKVIAPDLQTQGEPKDVFGLEQLARSIRMLGFLKSEHPQADVFNEALTLAANFLRSFIGREEYLPGRLRSLRQDVEGLTKENEKLKKELLTRVEPLKSGDVSAGSTASDHGEKSPMISVDRTEAQNCPWCGYGTWNGKVCLTCGAKGPNGR